MGKINTDLISQKYANVVNGQFNWNGLDPLQSQYMNAQKQSTMDALYGTGGSLDTMGANLGMRGLTGGVGLQAIRNSQLKTLLNLNQQQLQGQLGYRQQALEQWQQKQGMLAQMYSQQLSAAQQENLQQERIAEEEKQANSAQSWIKAII